MYGTRDFEDARGRENLTRETRAKGGAISENPHESRREWLLSMFRHAGENNPNNTTYQFWRQDNHPIELFTAEVAWQKLNYLHQNPVKEGIVEYPEEYLYSNARNYANRYGLLSITPIDPNA